MDALHSGYLTLIAVSVAATNSPQLGRMNRLANRWLPPVRVMHPYPEARFDARHPRQEPSAVVPHAGICAAGRP
jgi:hypothetical protein